MRNVGCGMWDLVWGMRHGNVLPQITLDTDAVRAAFIKKHETRRSPTDQRKVIAPMRTDGSFHGLFTLAPLPTAWGSMRRRRKGSTRIFCAGGKYDEVVCHMTGLGMRSDAHVPKGQKFIAQRQAKRRPGYNVLWSLRPVGAKVLKHRVMFTFALAGRDVIGCGGLPRVSLRLPWAEEVIGLSARLG